MEEVALVGGSLFGLSCTPGLFRIIERGQVVHIRFRNGTWDIRRVVAMGTIAGAAAGVVGGLLGGAILGSVLAPRPHYYAPAPVYVAPEPAYVEPLCIARQQVYDPYYNVYRWQRVQVPCY